MSVLRGNEATAQAGPAEAPPVHLDARAEFAARFLVGEGIEIGALHQPLAVPLGARVRYVDRMPVERLREEYPELADWKLTRVDLIDDGERLETIAEGSQDFIVANHFLEHCENPIGTIETHLAKLRPGGVLFYAVPDKRYTFDFRRPAVDLDHLLADYEEGPASSRRSHYEEYSRLVLGDPNEPEEHTQARASELEDAGYSIHMHAWTQAEFIGLLLACRERLDDGFDIEAAARQGMELVVVLRKQGPQPAIAPPRGERLKLRLRAALEKARGALTAHRGR